MEWAVPEGVAYFQFAPGSNKIHGSAGHFFIRGTAGSFI